MLRLRTIVLPVLLIHATMLFADKLSDCLKGCPPGTNACSNRCIDAYQTSDDAARLNACRDGCIDARRSCVDNCRAKNEAAATDCQRKLKCDPRTAEYADAMALCRGKQAAGCTTTSTRKDSVVYQACETAYQSCSNKCYGRSDETRTRDRSGDSKDEPCPFTCQRRNPRTKQCTGPESNRCSR
ncbi:MAG TPA: hypothetical protein VJ853_02170 [Thermoanaerobaculia bacterium]|nr:hypothetical protein [Thermoanaerobaculia bacterium]